jgi:hypothetical protein
MPLTDDVQKLYDDDGNLIGVLIGPEKWSQLAAAVPDMLAEQKKPEPHTIPEPLDDWNTLKEYWDFKYPVDYDVACEVCGDSTQNWEEDDPKQFRLLAANLGGLVRFECIKCKARITKRHFKDHIQVETLPVNADD